MKLNILIATKNEGKIREFKNILSRHEVNILSLLDLEFSPFEINLAWKGEQEEYLKIIEEGLSKEARTLIRDGAGFYQHEKLAQKPHIFLKQPGGHPEFKHESPVNLDHGVISALALLKGLGTPEEIQKNEEHHDYVLVARAIALHNFKASLKDYVFDEQGQPCQVLGVYPFLKSESFLTPPLFFLQSALLPASL